MSRINWSILIVFGALVALYASLFFKSDSKAIVISEDSELFPNYRALNLNSRLYNQTGKLSHAVQATKMEHFEALGFAVFENPVYTLYLDNSQPWQVSAKEATLYDNHRIILENQVKIMNLDSNRFVEKIATDYVEIDLNKKTISSDQLVEISGPNFFVTSVGLVGNLNTQQYELREHVNTLVDP